MGRVQVFADGSAAYWKADGEAAKPAASLEDACKKVWTVHATLNVTLEPVTLKATAVPGAKPPGA